MSSSAAGMALTPIPSLGGGAQDELERALERLQAGRGLLVRLADLMGAAAGRVGLLSARGLGLPANLQTRLRGLAEAALGRAFDIAVVGFRDGAAVRAHNDRLAGRAAQAMVVASGLAGGVGGVSLFLPDIGFTTVAIMREIARIAREEGEDLGSADGRRACLEVFALKGIGAEPGESELGYFSARAMMRGTPMVMLVSEVASRYGLALGQKLSLQMIPVAGALCGASLNAAFLAHYQELARAHFTIRRLERTHGDRVHAAADAVRERLQARVATT